LRLRGDATRPGRHRRGREPRRRTRRGPPRRAASSRPPLAPRDLLDHGQRRHGPGALRELSPVRGQRAVPGSPRPKRPAVGRARFPAAAVSATAAAPPALGANPRRGYALAALAAALWALNASIARTLLDDHLPALRLTQLRTTGAFLVLALTLAATRRDLLRVERADVPALAFVGIAGLALVQGAY